MKDTDNIQANTLAADAVVSENTVAMEDAVTNVDIVTNIDTVVNVDIVTNVDTVASVDTTADADGVGTVINVKNEPNPFRGILLGLFISLLIWALIFRIFYYIGK